MLRHSRWFSGPTALKAVLTGLVFILFLAGCATTAPNPRSLKVDFDLELTKGLPILQGLTNSHATQLAIVAPQSLTLRFTVQDGEKVRDIKPQTRTSKGSTVVVHHLIVNELKLGKTYQLVVSDSSERTLDQRDFKALDLSKRPARVVSASCLYDAFLKESHAMWASLLASRPELVLLIGDNVYAEVSDGRFSSPMPEEELWIRYAETFLVLDFYKTKSLVPTVVTWDDHDYGMKDGDASNPYKDSSRYVMESFFPQTPTASFPEFSAGPGVSHALSAFGYRFLLLDNRSFRTSPKAPATEERTHFGKEQEAWIAKMVLESRDPVWLISGDQWFGAYHRFESYEGRHPESLKKFLNSIRKSRVPVLFMSGDRHLSEVMRIETELLGYETYEITSSALHSRAHPSNWDTIPNKRHVMGIDLIHNFNVLDLTPMKKNGAVRLRGATIGPQSKALYTFDFTIQKR